MKNQSFTLPRFFLQIVSDVKGVQVNLNIKRYCPPMFRNLETKEVKTVLLIILIT